MGVMKLVTFEAIPVEVVAKKATVCDKCGGHTEPSCVYACPHDAARRVEPREFFELQIGELQFPDKGGAS